MKPADDGPIKVVSAAPPRAEPPHAFPAEQGVLGAALQNNELLAECVSMVK